MLHSMYLLFLIFVSNLSFSIGATSSMSYSSSSSSSSYSSSYDYVPMFSYTDEEEAIKKRKQEEVELLRKQEELKEQQQRIKLEEEQQRIKQEQEKNLRIEENERIRLEQEQEEEFKKFAQELSCLQQNEELPREQKGRNLEEFKQRLYSDTESLVMQSLINIANKVISEKKYANLIKKIVERNCLNEMLAYDIEIYHVAKENNVSLQQEEKLHIQDTSDKVEKVTLKSTDYKRIFRPLKSRPEDEEEDEYKSVGVISGTSILTEPKDSTCIYVPVKQGPQVCIYVPTQNDHPPLIYFPAEDDNSPCIYVLTKEEEKNFILQFAPPIIVIGGVIGSGGSIPVIIGIGVGIGWIIKEGVPLLRGIKDKIKKHREEKEKGGGGGNNNDDDDKDKNDKNKNNGAQAPGKPTENDGFIPKNNWDGKKVPNPNGPGWGWPDRDGNVWVPSGPKGHGGAHWYVQRPGKGKKYANIMPGGHERGKKNK